MTYRDALEAAHHRIARYEEELAARSSPPTRPQRSWRLVGGGAALAALTLGAIALLGTARRAEAGSRPFDSDAARAAIAAAPTATCGAATTSGHLRVRFQPDGAADEALVQGGTPEGTRCLAAVYGALRVPAFRGPPQTVGATIGVR